MLTFICPNSAETPDVSPSMVWFKDEAFHQTNPANLELNWDPFNLTLNSDAKVSSTVYTSTCEKFLNRLIN